MTDTIAVHAPGRVNLIGDHTDYAGGLALPCAIDLGVTIRGRRVPDLITMTSDAESAPTTLGLSDLLDDQHRPATSFAIDDMHPLWGRYVAAVAQECRTGSGFEGRVTSTLPTGAGLSSSAAFEIALALAFDFSGSPMELARLGQRAEHRAVGVPCGLLDQMSIVLGTAGHAMLIDFADLSHSQIEIPTDLDIVVMHSGQERQLVDSEYAERRASCELAAQRIGPLADADLDDVKDLDPSLAKRARHVVSECTRVRDAATALRDNDPITFGRLMTESHASLRDDFEVSTPTLDSLVDRLVRTDGVFGARLTGAGFGGCVVAICERGAIPDASTLTGRGWIVRPSDGARIISD